MQPTVQLSRRMGYELKHAQAALRAAMDEALRRHGLTVPQYACLELLGQRPGLSNAELARGAFVTRQSMNVVLRGLQDSGLVARPPRAPAGRALPARLTAVGEHRLAAARATVIAIEQRMTAALPPQRAAGLLADLGKMAQALEPRSAPRNPGPGLADLAAQPPAARP